MKRDLVSVVTPVYNGKSHIGRFLDSVLAQDYPDVEMILSDDGSDDGTADMAASYAPAFEEKGYTLRLVRNAHRNASAAVGAGLAYVSGEYLIWPDSDDELLPGSIGTRVRFLREHPEYRCVRSIMEYVSDGGGPAAGEKLGNLSKTDLFLDVLESRTFVCCGCYMLRTEPFFDIYPDRRIPVYDVGQNFQMLLPFLYKYPCPTIREVLYRVHVRPDSHSRRVLSESEEREKFRQFECLVDEIAGIGGIRDQKVLSRISKWKLRRRMYLRRKYKRFPFIFLPWRLV